MTTNPPRPTPYLELLAKGAHGAGLHVRDREGRPLGERSAPPSAKQGLEIEERISRYRGREGRSMNYSGYRQVMSNLAPAMAALAAVRLTYCRVFAVTDLSVAHLWRFSRIVSGLAAYLVFRRERPVADGDLSVTVAGLYKIGGGPFLTSARLLLHERDGLSSYREHMSPEDYLRYTEDEGVFNIGNGACAAPPRLVLDFFEHVMHGFPDTPAPLATLLPEVEDEDGFFRYASLCLMQDYTKIGYALETGALYADLARTLSRETGSDAFRRASREVASGTGWLFGIGKRIFDIGLLESGDPERLRAHADHLRRTSEIVRLEIEEIAAALETVSPWRPPSQSTDDVRAQVGALFSREEKARESLEDLEAEIAGALGWSAPRLGEDVFARAVEAPNPRRVVAAIGIAESEYSDAVNA